MKQRAVLRPYLHYVLDGWFARVIRRQSRGEAYYFRFADDFGAGFQYPEDARGFMERLESRLGQFGLGWPGRRRD
jgi:RNA-directed DNA polymerase